MEENQAKKPQQTQTKTHLKTPPQQTDSKRKKPRSYPKAVRKTRMANYQPDFAYKSGCLYFHAQQL